jgi:hypothetical protein
MQRGGKINTLNENATSVTLFNQIKGNSTNYYYFLNSKFPFGTATVITRPWRQKALLRQWQSVRSSETRQQISVTSGYDITPAFHQSW